MIENTTSIIWFDYIGHCGQAPGDHPQLAAFLVECGIGCISVTPDGFLGVKQYVADAEKRSGKMRHTKA